MAEWAVRAVCEPRALCETVDVAQRGWEPAADRVTHQRAHRPTGSCGARNDEVVSRRAFVANTVRAGTTGTAALWVAPKLTSVTVGEGATSSIPPEEPTIVSIPPAKPPPSGALPFTGFNALALTIVGGASVLAGRALLSLRRRIEQKPPGTPSAR